MFHLLNDFMFYGFYILNISSTAFFIQQECVPHPPPVQVLEEHEMLKNRLARQNIASGHHKCSKTLQGTFKENVSSTFWTNITSGYDNDGK